MVDVAVQPTSVAPARPAIRKSGLKSALRRKSTTAFLMTLPLILLIGVLVVYPAFYSLHLATLNKSMQKFVGFGNFTFLFKRDTFWLVVPAFYRTAVKVHWLDLLTFAGIGGIWLAVYAGALASAPLLPAHDPNAAPHKAI